MGKIYLTMRLVDRFASTAREPVGAYLDEAKAKDAVAKAKVAKEELRALYNQLLKPYGDGSCCYCDHPLEECIFPSKDSKFYSTQMEAEYADKRLEFEDRSDVQDCRRRDTGEDSVLTLDIIE